VSATQIVLVVLVILAFAFGWVASERRGRTGRWSGLLGGGEPAADATITAALTAYQAVLAVWQSGASWSPLLARALDTFDERRQSAGSLHLGSEAGPEALAALDRAQTALTRLGEGLAPLRQGMPLRPDHERQLAGQERRLAAARTALILASQRRD
jgi:hypothetical protein